MKFCPNCGATLADDATFCPSCGSSQGGSAAGGYAPTPAPGYTPGYPGYAPVAVDPYDHTAEFDPQDISDNKVVCMLIYLAGYLGILVALLLAGTSKYVGFHLRQALKIEVISLLTTVVSLLLCWTFIVPIAGGIFAIVLFVVRIICFFQICKGQAKEPAVVRSFGFLK